MKNLYVCDKQAHILTAFNRDILQEIALILPGVRGPERVESVEDDIIHFYIEKMIYII